MNSPDLDPQPAGRREFLQAGALASAAALTLGRDAQGAEPQAKGQAKGQQQAPLPTRKLGKTGIDVSILNQGTWRAPGTLPRILRTAYAQGVRYFDTAKVYGSEPGIASWFEAMPEVRKSIFLVSKDTTRRNNDRELAAKLPAMLDERLAELKTDYLDLFFIHGLGDYHDVDVAVGLLKSRELKQAFEKIRKSGKARLVGFSTHHPEREKLLQAAADTGYVDAIMLQHTAWLDKDTTLNRAMDACWDKGIGLISMKQIAAPDPSEFLAEVPKHAPDLIKRGLKPFQAMLHAIWTDERIASCCVSMRNLDQIAENAEAARNFEPLNKAEIDQLRNAFLASRPTLCADCDGRCAVAAGTKAPLGDLTRFLTYHERHGARAEARRKFAELPDEAKDWKEADLAAARDACPNKLDFATLLPRVEKYLA